MLEAGAVPRRSSVLPRVVAVLTNVEPAGNGLDEKKRDDGAHESG